MKEKTIVVPGIFFDINPSHRRDLFESPCHHFVRISFGPPIADLDKGALLFPLSKASYSSPLTIQQASMLLSASLTKPTGTVCAPSATATKSPSMAPAAWLATTLSLHEGRLEWTHAYERLLFPFSCYESHVFRSCTSYFLWVDFCCQIHAFPVFLFRLFVNR